MIAAIGRHRSRLPLYTLAGALTGLFLAGLMQFYLSAYYYPIIVGGKEYRSWEAFTPIFLGPLRWTLWMFHFWGAGVVGLLRIAGVRVEVRGREHIPTGAALVAPKHQCMLDVFAQFTWLPASAFVMKKELAWIPWFGWYGAKAGGIVIDRAGAAKSMLQVIREGTERFA